jgi:hypothetical protein
MCSQSRSYTNFQASIQNKRRVTERLTSVRLKHWIKAVQNGDVPTITDPETKKTIPLRMPLAVADGDGLTFTLSISGTASWILRYRYGGRARELTIGNYPDIGVAEAREKARAKRAEIDQGGDPAADKRKAAMIAYQDWTVRRLVEDYREKVLISLGQSTQRTDAFNAYQAGGISGVQTTVQNCYQNLDRSASNPTAGKDMQYCVSLDLAGFQIDRGFANAAKTPQQPYFLQNAVSNRTHKALAGSASPDVIEGLLRSWYKTTGAKLSIKLR